MSLLPLLSLEGFLTEMIGSIQPPIAPTKPYALLTLPATLHSRGTQPRRIISQTNLVIYAVLSSSSAVYYALVIQTQILHKTRLRSHTTTSTRELIRRSQISSQTNARNRSTTDLSDHVVRILAGSLDGMTSTLGFGPERYCGVLSGEEERVKFASAWMHTSRFLTVVTIVSSREEN